MEWELMKYVTNWEETQQRFIAWWRGEPMDRPLLRVIARRNQPLERLEPIKSAQTPEELHLDAERLVKECRNYCRTHTFLAEAFPSVDINMGPGSLAVYLGVEPIFAWDTVWYKEIVKNGWKAFGSLKYDPDNYYWKKHLEIIKRAQKIAKGDFFINIPDLIENLDILSAMRGPQDFCFDLIDEPDMMKQYIKQVDELYFNYYNEMYDIVKGEDGCSSYTAFHIWGPGRTAKIQCDFSALMSPRQFRDFAQSSLRKQCQQLNSSVYHLDGPDAIKHLDALMEIEELNALQWTAGAGQPDGGSEKWYPIYDKVRDAGKSLWIALYDGSIQDCMDKADLLVKRYGSQGMYLIFPEMEEEEAQNLLRKAEKEW